MFCSRAEVLLHNPSPEDDVPTPEEAQNWYVNSVSSVSPSWPYSAYLRRVMYNLLFDLLRPRLHLLFPSVRISLVTGVSFTQVPNADVLDQPVWEFLSTFALFANEEQQQALVGGLREVVLENVATANKGWGTDSDDQLRLRLANVNAFLRSFGLDASQIQM